MHGPMYIKFHKFSPFCTHSLLQLPTLHWDYLFKRRYKYQVDVCAAGALCSVADGLTTHYFIMSSPFWVVSRRCLVLCYPNCTHVSSPYRAVNTLSYKNRSLLYSEIVAVCSDIHAKHTNTLCGLNEKL